MYRQGCVCVYLSEAVVIDEIRSVSVDQSVEGEAVLPAVGQSEQMSVRQWVAATCLSALTASYHPQSRF